MDATRRIERGLERALSFATAGERPPTLCQAVRHAVFPGGARVRPRLTLAVAMACGDENPQASDAAATAIELLHCASLVHDDMPCFDNAAIRRGLPSVHTSFGEPLALLAGDALIVLAFETLARECALVPDRIAPLIAVVARAVGMPHGIVAGQGWESEGDIPLAEYHRTKTGALFTGAVAAGAVAAGADAQVWLALGERLGAAYQVADDLCDYASSAADAGKPCRQDIARGRPNVAVALGTAAAVEELERQVEGAVAAIPACPGNDMLTRLVRGEAKRLVPKSLVQHAA